jgi:hypothetical protein
MPSSPIKKPIFSVRNRIKSGATRSENMGNRIQGNTKIMDSGTAKDFIEDLQNEIIVLRKEREEWRNLTERALNQIDEWKSICERWEKRYNELLARIN